MSGTITLNTDRLLLRRYHIEDAQLLHKLFGIDEKMFEYSGWNPYETIEMAQETIQGFIDSYADEHSYSWVIDYQEQLVGTIGAYDYDPNTKSIEIGCSIAKDWWGHGFASEAIREVLRYLLEKEKIRYIRAWCASDNVGSIRAMEHAGMALVRSEKNALTINGKSYDKLHYGICYSSMVKRVERIKRYEQILDHVNCIMDQSPDVIEGFESIRTDIQKLEEYYCSPEWKEDYDAEAAGRLPADLKRGVLSQDEIAKGEQETRNLLVRFEQDYPGAAKRDNVDEIARTLQRKESRVSVLTKLQEKKEEARQKGTNLPSKKEE